ncbi:MAG: hypothetical protein GKS04_01130 [Candidatus Mycalebacterium zealandia]|nr:MAG: hypothetical protein GKS04_01130 [Candidatus Mycalebacterium zealandia]
MNFSKIFSAAILALLLLAIPRHSFAESKIEGEIGYKKGLYYQSADGKFKIKQNFRIQFRGDVMSDNVAGSDTTTDLMVRRVKMKLGGHAYEKWIKWGLQLAGSAGRSGKGEEMKVEDAFIVIAKNKAADLKMGRFKVSYGREVLNSSSALQFVDRSFVKEFIIDTSRGDGISVGGIMGNMIAYRTGLFQRDGKTFDGGRNVLWTGRVQANICCGELKYSSGTFTASGDYKISPNFAKVPVFALGFGGFYDSGTDAAIDRIGATDLVAGTTSNATGGFTLDLIAKIQRANFEAAFYYGSTKDVTNATLGDDNTVGGTGVNTDTAASTGTLTHTAYRIQGGFMMTPNFEIATRWAYADYDTGYSNNEWRWTTGLNWYIAAKHRTKVQLDYTYGNEKDGISSGADKKENIFRGQIQIDL